MNYNFGMIVNKLSGILGSKRMKMTELCKLTGLSKTYVFDLYHDNKASIKFETLDKICKALECSVHDLFEYIPD